MFSELTVAVSTLPPGLACAWPGSVSAKPAGARAAWKCARRLGYWL